MEGGKKNYPPHSLKHFLSKNLVFNELHPKSNQNKIKKYDQEASTVGDAVNATRQTEVQDLVKRITDYRDNAQKELQKKEADMVKPLMDKIKASIAKVGKAKGYQYVLNLADLLLADGPDLTADVKKDLGF